MTGITTFQEYMERFPETWSGVEVRAISIRHSSANLLLGATIRLTGEVASTKGRGSRLSLPDEITAQRRIVPLDRLPDILSGLSTGHIVLGDERLIFGRVESQGFRLEGNPSFSFEFDRRTERYSWLQPRIDWPYLVARITGEQLHNVFGLTRWKSKEGLEWELRGLERPFIDLDDLFVSFLDLRRSGAFGRYGSCFALLAAPIPVRFSGCQFVEDTIQVAIEAGPRIDPCKIEVRIVESCFDEPISRRTVTLPKSDTSGVTFRRSQSSVTHVVAYLCYRGVVVDTAEAHDLRALDINPRTTACQLFDVDLNLFKQFLLGKGKDKSADFETAIALLLHFLGFSVAHFGRTGQYQDAIDVVAFSPDNSLVLAVECTLQEPDVKNKLSKLIRRSAQLAEGVGSGKRVRLVLFTSLSEKHLATSDIDRARTDKVVLLTAEDAETLLVMSLRNVGAEEAWRWIDERIPRDMFEMFGGER